MPTALRIAADLAAGSRHALAATKRTLNHWVRAAAPIFESSLAMEMLGFFSDDAREGLAAMQEKRRPKFPSSQGAQA
jgi:enoyl-CoA hydratase